jgi:hypothetical protein
MKSVRVAVYAAACVAISVPEGFAPERSDRGSDVKSQVERAVARIRAGHAGEIATLRHLGKEAIPVLNGLCRFPVETLKKHSPDKMLEVLAVHAGRWCGTSDKAALLIGDLGGKSQMDALRKILRQAGTIHGDMDVRTHLVPRMEDACVKALFKLGDKNATERVRASLKRRDIPSIVFAIEAVAYAGKKEYLSQLLPLLDDTRDARKIAPGWNYYLKVRDLALNAIVEVSGIRPSFRLQSHTRYTDDEVAEVKKLIAEAKTN